MSNIIVKGNVGEVRLGQHQNVEFLSWSMAENHGYFDKTTGKWVEKGTEWHNCSMSFINNNERYQRYCKLIQKGTPLVVVGRTSMRPSEGQNEKGEKVIYDNKYIQVDTVGVTLDRVESITYRQRQDDIDASSDPELQQRGFDNSQQDFHQPMPGENEDPFSG